MCTDGMMCTEVENNRQYTDDSVHYIVLIDHSVCCQLRKAHRRLTSCRALIMMNRSESS